MAFFAPRAYSPYAPHQPAATEPSFHGLFRLLEDWDNHHNSSENTNSSTDNKQQARPQLLQQPQQQQQRQQPGRQQRQQPAQPAYFTPRFDIVETDAAYELYGELPGVDKKDVEIEFSDPQTLIVKGHIERTVSSASAETRDVAEDDAVVVDHAADDHAETSSQRSFRATVEDGDEDDGTATASSNKADQKTTTSADTTVATTAPSTVATTEKPQQPTHKYWLAERHAGPFSRTFAFPERLDLDGVKASLHNGVLALTVPKARKYEGRRINLL